MGYYKKRHELKMLKQLIKHCNKLGDDTTYLQELLITKKGKNVFSPHK